MKSSRSKPSIDSAAAKLREIIWNKQKGDRLGSEDDMVKLLEFSRPTVRQAARLVESEGLLVVKRGIHGGYYASRPSVEVIESAVSAYLKMMVADQEEVTEIASVLWELIVRRAAEHPSEQRDKLTQSLKDKILKLKSHATFDELLEIEDATREGLFDLVNSPYIELIFHINRVFAATSFTAHPSALDASEEHAQFSKAWRQAKLLELEAIESGDSRLSQIAARHARSLFHKRLYGHERENIA